MAKKKKPSFWEENKVNLIGWGIVILLVGGFFVMSQQQQQQADEVGSEVLAVREDDNVKGNPAADKVLIEYSDFECPACQTYYPIIDAGIEEFGDDFVFVYRHFPLESIHANAEAAAIASEAAGRQGQFWEMHDLLFNNQQAWARLEDPTVAFNSFAEQLDLDLEQFESDVNDPALAEKVNSQQREASQLGVSGTPTFFLNGERVDIGPSLDSLRQVIQPSSDAPEGDQEVDPVNEGNDEQEQEGNN